MKKFDTTIQLAMVILLLSFVVQRIVEYQYDKIVYLYVEDSAGINKGKIELESKDWKQYINSLDTLLNKGNILTYTLYQGDRVVHSKTQHDSNMITLREYNY